MGRCPRTQRPERELPNTIPRPHSADFLEYETNHRNIGHPNVGHQRPRPRSSLDITANASDMQYYSERSYAENIRREAQNVLDMLNDPEALANMPDVDGPMPDRSEGSIVDENTSQTVPPRSPAGNSEPYIEVSIHSHLYI